MSGHMMQPPTSDAVPSGLVWPSLLAALVVLAGSIWLSVGMGLKACPLCFYQRTFVMGVVGVLGAGLLLDARHRSVLNLLALPLAIGGLAVAGFHVTLEVAGKLECPLGIAGLGTAPQQSLAALVVLVVVIGVGIVRGERRLAAALVGILLGLALAALSVWSAPPLPPVPSKVYETPLDTCRPPFRG